MGSYKEIEGDLIKLALDGEFEVITHGCNCFCTMGSGIAPLFAKNFFANTFEKEKTIYKGDINKLGTIDFDYLTHTGDSLRKSNPNDLHVNDIHVIVVNSYSQYYYGSHPSNNGIPLDYNALALCMKKINYTFKGKSIGLPLIGCGLAKGDWAIVKKIIQEELKDMDVTIVKLPK